MGHRTVADMRFHGVWIGETQGCEMPAHHWEIAQQGARLFIRTAWEGEPVQQSFFGRVLRDAPAFVVGAFTATLVDPQHFVIPGWDTNDMRQGEGPAYDVVFSRPGLAELTAGAAWRRFLAGRAGEPAG